MESGFIYFTVQRTGLIRVVFFTLGGEIFSWPGFAANGGKTSKLPRGTSKKSHFEHGFSSALDLDQPRSGNMMWIGPKNHLGMVYYVFFSPKTS